VTTYIYGLIDPTNNKISYIGQSIDPFRRWGEHCDIHAHTSKGEWIHRLAASGIKPIVVILDEVHGGNVFDVELWWIEFGRRMGWPLTNSTSDLSSKYDLSTIHSNGKPKQYHKWVYEEAASKGMDVEEYRYWIRSGQALKESLCQEAGITLEEYERMNEEDMDTLLAQVFGDDDEEGETQCYLSY
jgi:hypothetical protein